MNCHDVQKFAFTYLDAEFDARERGEFEEHLRLCGGCRGTVARDAMLKDLVARHLQPPNTLTPEQLRAKVCAGMDRAERRQLQQTVGMVVALAAVIVVVIVTQSVPSDHREPSDNKLLNQDPPMQAVAAIAPTAEPRIAEVAVPNKERTAPSPAAAMQSRVRVPAPRVASPVPQPLPQALAAGRAAASAENNRDSGGFAQVRRVASSTTALVSAQMDNLGEVLGGGLAEGAMVERSPFGAVRSEDSLRQMVQLHLADLTPEISGSPQRIERYLQARVPGVGALPLAQGAGVTLRGARIAVIGGQVTVIYSYTAFGSPLTVVSRAPAHSEEPDVEELGPDRHAPSGVLLDRRAGLHLLHVVARDRVLTLIGELAAPAMMQLLPPGALL